MDIKVVPKVPLSVFQNLRINNNYLDQVHLQLMLCNLSYLEVSFHVSCGLLSPVHFEFQHFAFYFIDYHGIVFLFRSVFFPISSLLNKFIEFL